MYNSKTISVLFTLDNSKNNNKGHIEYPDDITSLVFGVIVGDEVNGIELVVEYIEQVYDDKVEIECMLYDWDIHAMYNIIKNPVSVVVGTTDGELEIEPSMLSVKELTELREDGDIKYCTDTLAKDLTRI